MIYDCVWYIAEQYHVRLDTLVVNLATQPHLLTHKMAPDFSEISLNDPQCPDHP